MSLAKKNMSDETKEKMSDAKKGMNVSDETKAKMSLAKKGRPKTEETKAKMSASQIDSMVSIEVFDLETQIKTIYPSMSAVAKALNVPYGSIRNYFSKKRLKPFKGRYVLKKLIA